MRWRRVSGPRTCCKAADASPCSGRQLLYSRRQPRVQRSTRHSHSVAPSCSVTHCLEWLLLEAGLCLFAISSHRWRHVPVVVACTLRSVLFANHNRPTAVSLAAVRLAACNAHTRARRCSALPSYYNIDRAIVHRLLVTEHGLQVYWTGQRSVANLSLSRRHALS